MEPTKISSLDDLGGTTVPVTLRRPDGSEAVIELRALSEGEIWDIRRGNKWPEAPVVEMTKSGPIKNFSDPTYQASVEDTNRRFAQKMLLASLPFVVPGEHEDDRLATLRAKVGQYVYAQLIDATQRINLITPEEIARVADTFRPAGHGRASSDGSAEPDAGPVA